MFADTGCACGGVFKKVVKLRAIFSGDVDRELGYKYVPLTKQSMGG
jgi:hypothetical protein